MVLLRLECRKTSDQIRLDNEDVSLVDGVNAWHVIHGDVILKPIVTIVKVSRRKPYPRFGTDHV